MRPFGILGGGSAAAGVNLLLRADGRTVNMGAKNIVHLAAGERLRILTPGAVVGASGSMCLGSCPAQHRTSTVVLHLMNCQDDGVHGKGHPAAWAYHLIHLADPGSESCCGCHTSAVLLVSAHKTLWWCFGRRRGRVRGRGQ